MDALSWLLEPDAWVALVTLTALEVVLGIDNVIFISILAGKLPPGQQAQARRLGLGLAMLHPHPAPALPGLAGAPDGAPLYRRRARLLRP